MCGLYIIILFIVICFVIIEPWWYSVSLFVLICIAAYFSDAHNWRSFKRKIKKWRRR